MKSFIKTPEEIKILRECGRRLARVLDAVEEAVSSGISTMELDMLAEKLIRAGGDDTVFKGYRPWDTSIPYPATICISINDEVVHGIPRTDKILKEGDIVGLDLGIRHKGLITDSARTVPVGKISEKATKLLEITKQSLGVGIAAASNSLNSKYANVSDIGYAIQKFVQPYGYGIVRELGGHGVGHKLHEDPFIPNFASRKGVGAELKPNMVIAIEPMLTIGKPGIFLEKDGYTYRTRDRSLAAHFEHTILITESKPEILTLSL